MRFYIVSLLGRRGFVRVVWDGSTNRAVAAGQRTDENLRAFCERLNTEETLPLRNALTPAEHDFDRGPSHNSPLGVDRTHGS